MTDEITDIKVSNGFDNSGITVDPPMVETPPVDSPPAPPVDTPPPPAPEPPPQPSFSDLLNERYGMDEEGLKATLEKAKLLNDDYITEAAKYYSTKGDMTPYLEAHSHKFDQMEPRDIIAYDIRNNPDYRGVSQKTLNELVEREMVEKYGQVDIPELDEDGENSAEVKELTRKKEIGKELLDLRIARRKGELIEEQKKFRAPERTPDAEPDMSGFLEKVQSDPATKSIKEAKTLKYGDFAFGVEPEGLVESAIDPNKFWENFRSDNGADLDKFYKVAAFAKNPTAVIDGLIKHGMALARAEMAKEDKNATPPAVSSPHTPSGEITDIKVVN